jgi:hypothetical protein
VTSLEAPTGSGSRTQGTPAAQPAPAPPAGGDGYGPGDGDWAVCCSGGGIRSAAYCLGALQSLDRGGLLANVKWILGVSGGSYIASSRALVAKYLRDGAAARDAAAGDEGAPRDGEAAGNGKVPHAYAPGTPEERNLRYDTRYIAPNGSILLTGVLSLLLGVVCTFVIALAPVYAAAHVWGWFLRWAGILVPAQPHGMTAAVTVHWWWLLPAAAGVLMLITFLYWWWTIEPGKYAIRGRLLWLKHDDHDRSADRAWLVGVATTLAAGLALAMLAVPPAISWLDSSTGSVGTIAHFLGFGGKPSWAALGALLAAVTAVAKYVQTGISKWTATTTAKDKSAAPQPGWFGQLAARARQLLLPWVASAVVVLIGVVLALLWISDGAREGFSLRQLWFVCGAVGITLLARPFVNVNRLALHDFYRWRLADAFAVTREAAEASAKEKNPVKVRELFAKASATRLSQLAPDPSENGRGEDGSGLNGQGKQTDPGLVICATANINAARQVAPGRGGFCLTFDPEQVVLHREKSLRDQEQAPERAEALTCDFEALVGYRRATLFDVSAISGAAVSPLMGSATRHAYRILFTATNVRLGVWLPHPNVVRAARQALDDEQAKTGRWLLRHPIFLLLWYTAPHRFWSGNAEKNSKREDRNAEREAHLWAHVLKLRIDPKADERARQADGATAEKERLRDKWRRWRGAVWYRLLQPTLGLLRAEAFGQLSYRATWMYVTDGGHYDNLGLVEALRRGAKNIVVLDASGDKADTWFTLGGAIELARTDAGVEINLDPTVMLRGGRSLAPGQVMQPWAYGTFCRPESEPGSKGDPALPRTGQIWVCKLGWWTGAPWDVLAYAKHHPTYPCDSTIEQLYDANEFSAYQELGAATVLNAANLSPSRAKPSKLPLPSVPDCPARNGSAPRMAAPVLKAPPVT